MPSKFGEAKVTKKREQNKRFSLFICNFAGETITIADMKRSLLLLAAVACMGTMSAQSIDFNKSGQDKTETGYTSWMVGTETAIQKTIDGITFNITREDGSAGLYVYGEWWKDGVNKYSKLLTSDGITIAGKEGDEKYTLRSGYVAMKITISGLSAGSHSLLAYHNNPAGFNGAPLKVMVNGTTLLENVQQTNRALSTTESGQSYVKFEATEGQPVTVIYQTVPDPGVDYTQGYNTTSLYVNALVLDRPNPLTTASTPMPENTDEHANYDDGKVTLQWAPAALAVKHHVYMGTAKDAMALVGTTTECTLEQRNLNFLSTYYWRVDEEDKDGHVYEGDTWQFRPRRLAFPDAEGYGRFAIGGRGGAVYHVTSLDDDVDNPQPGTFRYGITKVQGPRTIVFDVAGVIYLKGRLTCSDKYVTIAGQTAPGRGIMLRGAPFGMASDGITRFLRMRRGHILDDADANRGLDGLGMTGNDHSIMDHCSISWTIDEGFSSRGAKNITLQRTLISEALNVAGHPNYSAGTAHGYAATIGGGENGGLGSSFHHNLLAHNEGRNWSMSGGLDGAGSYDGHHDMFNNVCYNWGGRATDGGTHEGQFVNNYYKMGPATTKTIIMEATLEGPHPGTQSYYVNGNIRENRDGSKTQDAEGVTYEKKVKAVHEQQWDVFVNQPFFPSYATIEKAEDAFQSVLSDVGCNQPALDNHDERMVNETLMGTTTTKGSKSNKQGLIDHEDDAEGYAGLNIFYSVRPEEWDTDQDGIPDWFEKVVGTNVNTATNNDDRDGDGYTDLEEYLNWLAAPHFLINTDTETTIDLRPYFAGFETFNVVDDGLHPTDGFEWNFNGTSLVVKDAVGQRLYRLRITVKNPQTGYEMTRQFNFCASDEAVEMGMGSLQANGDIVRSGTCYDLQGRRLTAPKHGINVQQGYKFVVR